MIEMKKIMSGCFLVEIGSKSILTGCPSEILKVLKNLGIEMPTIIVLPSFFYWEGIIQADLEFPLYNFLFMQGRYFQGEKLKVIGTTEQINRMQKLLHLTLLGPTKEQLEHWNISNPTQQALTAHWALKKNGRIEEIDDMVDFIAFNEKGEVSLDNVNIKTNDKNVFTFIYGGESLPVDINIFGEQVPAIPIQLDESMVKGVTRSTFGALTLSKCTTDFDPTGYPTGFILWLNSMAILVDGVPWLKEHLRQLGISPTEIKVTILSHIHGDHASIVDLILNGHRVKVMTSREIFKSFVAKISLLIDWSEQKIEEAMDFIEVYPGGQSQNRYGARFTFFHAAHTVATIGFSVECQGKRIVYSGDTAWGKKLEPVRHLMSTEAFDLIEAIPSTKSDLTLMDGGGGIIHADPLEINTKVPEMQKMNIFLTHCPQLPESITGLHQIYAGQEWILIHPKTIGLGDLNAILNSPILAGISRAWINTILCQSRIISAVSEKTVLKQGELGKDFYLVLDGTFRVIDESTDEVMAKLGAGDFFSEISIIEDIPCTATVKLGSRHGKLLAIPKNIFLEFIQSTKLKERLRKIHRVRPVLIQCGWMKNFSAETINRIVELSEERNYQLGAKIITQGEEGEDLFFIREGKASVIVTLEDGSSRKLATLYRGQFFGEMALLGNGKRMATVKSEEKTSVLVVSRQNFEVLAKNHPILQYTLGVISEERRM